ncbi:MAG: UDPGP type 1 family protein [Thermoguttaceae bacterium]|nr:UDPGP type 1 family protein [Thermoguttaceae bacterium]MDW8037119.1 UDPGP type 1 family protein [Thermoguttaceae bacterium]
MNTSEPSYQNLVEWLARYGQEHVLAFWDRLGLAERIGLARQLEQIDLELLSRLWERGLVCEDVASLLERAESPPGVRLDGTGLPFSSAEARHQGEHLLRQGRVGVILVAGGQGTRLGFPHPKGMFPIGPISRKTLFQIHLEKVLAVGRRYGVRVPLYVMTSPATDQATRNFLEEHQFFGLPREDVVVFCQGMMPAVDAQTGKLLLEGPGRLALSPDGHGGLIQAMARTGALQHAQQRGLEHFFYFQVDNPLVPVCDPLFLGWHLLAQSEMTTLVIAKRHPLERVGNVISVDGRLYVIEYSDLPEELAHRRKPDGSLLLWAGSIAVHAIGVDFLARMSQQADQLPFHRARKKVPYVDSQGQLVHPDQPNAIKWERFIFDILPYAQRAIVVEGDPQECFAPLKNASGAKEDTPESVEAQMSALYARWLRLAGVEVADGVLVEISPLFALDAEQLRAKLSPGTRISGPTYFG